VLLLSTDFNSAAEPPRAADELKWARHVVDDFFELVGESPANVGGLLSPELATALHSNPRDYTVLDQIRRWGYKDWKISSQEVSPDGTEIIYRGIVKGNKALVGPDSDFKIRVAKESKTGKWSIRYIKLQERSFKEK
jgi:hypothetical protein